MKLATYNINSVRLRLERVIRLLRDENIDVLCLQETKVADELFPQQAFVDAGWPHVAFSGEKSYNGVAIISRLPLSDVQVEAFINEQKRHVSAVLPDGTRVHNFYVPAGGDEPDVVKNPKFQHKLDYVDAMRDYFGAGDHAEKMILVGDLNIAPGEHDVWSHKQLLKIISHTPVEVEKLNAALAAGEWVDVAREFVPESEKLYSWWSYRGKDWRASDRGRRLDHIWVTPALQSGLTSFEVLKDWRDGTETDKPSDHVPVVVDISGSR